MEVTRLPNRFDKNCPCKKDCENRSAECRKTRSAWADYEQLKAEEYARRAKIAEDYQNKSAHTANAKARQKRQERAVRRGKCHWR